MIHRSTPLRRRATPARLARLALLAVLALSPVPGRAQPAAWSFAPPLPKAMGEIVGLSIGHSMFVVAGLDDHDYVPEGVLYRFDAGGTAWTPLAPMPVPAHHVMATVLDGKIYVFGGFTRPADQKAWQPTANAWVYDPAGNAWSALAPLPRPRGAGQAVAAGGRIYVVGGAAADPKGATTAPILPGRPGHTVVGFVDAYDPATNSWSPRADMPTPRNHFLAAESGGKIYAIDGRIGAVFVTMAGITDIVEEYDPVTDRWQWAGRAPVNRGDVSGAVVNGRIYVAGGEFQDTDRKMAFWTVEAFDPVTRRWETLPHMQVTRHGFAMTAMEGALHAVGGSVQSDGMPGIFSETATHEVLPVAPRQP